MSLNLKIVVGSYIGVVILCDHCRKEIEDPTMGISAWFQPNEEIGDNGAVLWYHAVQLHKRCLRKYEKNHDLINGWWGTTRDLTDDLLAILGKVTK